MPMATPASAAPRTGAALSPHENALRLPPPRLPDDERFGERFDERLWVRVGMELLLGWNCPFQRLEEAARSGRERPKTNARRMNFRSRWRAARAAAPEAAVRPGFAVRPAPARARSAAHSKPAAAPRPHSRP